MSQTKPCPRCDQDLPITEFAFRNKSRGTRQSYCRACSNASWREWYAKPTNKSHHAKVLAIRRKKRIEKNRVLVRNLKSKPCVDCGGTYPPEAMDFDHLEEKDNLISKLVFQVSTLRLLAEIAKCELVCANCHRIRTATRVRDATKNS